MSDERIVEVLGEALIDCNVDKRAIRHALAALRAEGYDLYRPDECEIGTLLLVQTAGGAFPSAVVPIEGGSFDELPLRSLYRLVPVSEGTEPRAVKRRKAPGPPAPPFTGTKDQWA